MTTLLYAQECFEKANQLFLRGHYLDAQALYERAHALEPENPMYAEARSKLAALAFSFFKKGSPLSENAANATECCCECCGEGCCEGICEGICSNCDGCDCDCD